MPRRSRGWRLVLICLLPATLGLALPAPTSQGPAKRDVVVFIGAAHSGGPGIHDFPAGLRALARLVETAPGKPRLRTRVYADGWPTEAGAFDDAATLVWYFEGGDRHPLRSPAVRAQAMALARAGVGLVSLHQASTVPAGDDLDLPALLGGMRPGLFDRSTEFVEVRVAGTTLPFATWLQPFSYRDEFYPTLALGKRATPLLRTRLHPQHRGGQDLLESSAEEAVVAWAYQRTDGGRSVSYTGAHFLSAFEQPGLRAFLLGAVRWTAGQDAPPAPAATFHQDRGRSGWHDQVDAPSRAEVGAGDFGLAWESPAFAQFEGQAPRLYASPLYLDQVQLDDGPLRGVAVSMAIAATSNGDVYAVNARRVGDLAPGRILWRAALGAPCRLQPAPLDGVPTGILSTPVADLARQRLYVTHCSPGLGWQAHAIDLRNGRTLPGWPVRLDEDALNAVNANAGPVRLPPTRKHDFRVQRGALNLSPDGRLLYVTFGETETGWLAAVDTDAPSLRGAFATAAMPHRGSGGMWGAGGPAVDADGSIFVATGSGFNGYKDQDRDWTQSLIKLAPPTGSDNFRLLGTYTPFNHCQAALRDIDLGSGGPALLPRAFPKQAPLLAIGGKQGNLVLLDRDRLPGRLDRRPPCSDDSASDGSLLPPEAQPQFGRRGPLNLFGPYSEVDAALDLARARSVPAVFRDGQGREFLYATGNTKEGAGSAVSVPPSLIKVAVERPSGRTAYLRVDRVQERLVLGNPGSPVVSSRGFGDAIVWVLDENAPRSASLAGPTGPRPVLYAFDAGDLRELWRSPPGQLHTSGKYNEPSFGANVVIVGTDRLQAFGRQGALRDRIPPGAAAAVATVPPAAKATAATPSSATLAPRPLTPAERLEATQLYAARCAACHDQAQGNIPPREVLAGYAPERIARALHGGIMRAQAQGLEARQIDLLSRFFQ